METGLLIQYVEVCMRPCIGERRRPAGGRGQEGRNYASVGGAGRRRGGYGWAERCPLRRPIWISLQWERGLWRGARSGADDCGGNGKALPCLLPCSANAQRGEGRSLRFGFVYGDSLYLLIHSEGYAARICRCCHRPLTLFSMQLTLFPQNYFTLS